MKANISLFFSFILLAVIFFACKKPQDIPTVKTVEVKIIPQQTKLSLDLVGEIISDGNDMISKKGFCISLEPDPSIADINITSSNSSSQNFYATALDLEDGNYYVRAYAINSQGIGYGNVMFTGEPTLPVVEIVKTEINSLPTLATALVTGRLWSNGGATISRVGICLSTKPGPTIADTVIDTDLQANYVFISNFLNLDNNTRYYARAYAENLQGIGYSSEVEIVTKSVPMTENEAAIQIDTSKAVLQAMAYPKNTNTAIWFEYGETQSFGQQTEVVYLSGKEGVVVSIPISDLSPGKVYYYRAKSSNLQGENNGLILNFETYGLKDIDGNLYHVVTIGDKIWTRENLKVEHYNDGLPINHITNMIEWQNDVSGAFGYYNNDTALRRIYGNLYNFYVIENNHDRLVSPGWHVPTDEEWFELLDDLGVGQEYAGGLMKEAGYIHWQEPNHGATNSSNFTGLPAGYIFEGYGHIRKGAYFWSSTPFGSMLALSRTLYYEHSYLGSNLVYTKNSGFSIRLIKD